VGLVPKTCEKQHLKSDRKAAVKQSPSTKKKATLSKFLLSSHFEQLLKTT